MQAWLGLSETNETNHAQIEHSTPHSENCKTKQKEKVLGGGGGGCNKPPLGVGGWGLTPMSKAAIAAFQELSECADGRWHSCRKRGGAALSVRVPQEPWVMCSVLGPGLGGLTRVPFCQEVF